MFRQPKKLERYKGVKLKILLLEEAY